MKQNLFFKTLLFFLLSTTIAFAQETITGIVKESSTGTPIPSANVIVKGTTNGTVTDFDGNYSITVDDLPVELQISSLGFENKSLTVSTAGAYNISLSESATNLDEVVVTGLATSVKRANSANAISSISAEKLVGVAQPQTLDGALAGKFTGAIVSANSGAPGGGLSVKLRGTTSVFGNSQPLYIVDGVYVDNSSISAGLNAVSAAAAGGSASNQDNPTNRIADLDPNDIENIEILKGASAAAIYGSRAAAGVVIITTKKGAKGKTSFKFNQSVGFNDAINLLGLREYNEERVRASFGDAAVADFVQARDSGNLVDYEDELYGENGFITNTAFSTSGGSEKTSFYAGISHKNESGIVKNTGYERTSLRLNLDHRVSDNIKLNLNTNYINSSSDRGFFNNDNSGTTIGVTLTGTPPWVDLFPDSNGNYPDNPNGASNPLQTRDLVTNNEQVNRIIMGGSLDWTFYRTERTNLKLIAQAGLDEYDLTTRAIFPKELQFQKPSNGGVNGVSVQGSNTNKNLNYSAFLVHNFFTDSNINFRTQAGGTRLSFDRNSYLITAQDLIASETNIDQAGSQQASQFRLRQEDVGFFVQEEINFKDKLIGTIGVRGDKSSNNGESDKFYYYPKASLATNIHNFEFWKFSAMNQFKLRAAYGEAGNFPAFGSQFTSFNSTLMGGLNGASVNGISLNGVLGNQDIQPERQKELELGADLGFLDNRIGVTFTYYKKEVENLILNAANEPSSGFITEVANAGSLENQGFEVSLNFIPIASEGFNWTSGFNFWKNTSEITRLDIPAFNLGAFGATLGTFRIEEGKSATQIVGISPDGLVQFGDAEPDFQITFRNNLQVQNFELAFLFHWKKGGDNINLTTLLSDLNGTSHDYDDFGLDPTGALPNGDYRVSQLGTSAAVFVEDASYLRLRELGLYYNLPKSRLDQWFNNAISSIRVGITGTNLLNFFDYNSYDPEVSNFGSNGISTGVEVTPFPSSKRFMFNFSVNF
ncbi:SusC/RagA family TonB-linked outer membrane protein [Galbibacter sp. BG1]|uniref:SusC/RagA family TonB-linked outer membrane protein n=1 Tax=Galbibacter sp. BG1 TaxID=1170699 RepID=UPI0015BD70CD|nr:SusC/RagA family TonB-linked outer membrane protein [Galbibacter sp. BG1]QLE00611.1 SusC/RagA family TonB-linked outer membrane protein [Galbibacter sp. BG1]